VTRKYCQHCGGELADGVLPFIVPIDGPPAEPRPGEPCRCDEVVEDFEVYHRTSDPRIASERAEGGNDVSEP
jgi:hypothetical protein